MQEPSSSDKAAVLAKLLVDRGALCTACIAAHSALALSDIQPTARRLEQTFVVDRDRARCTACGRSGMVYSLFGISAA